MANAVDHVDTLKRLLPPVSYAPAAGSVEAELRSAAALLDEAFAAALRLRMEADPRATGELLEDFELAYGVPDYCSDLELTVADRRLAVLAKITETGSQTPVYFERIAVALGYHDVHVVEYLPNTCEDECTDAITGDGWRNTWAIASSDSTRITYLDCEGPCNEPFANWTLIEPLQCLINRLKPAHTICFFDFGN